eukprot:g33551.t1
MQIDWENQFEKEKLESDVMVLELSKANYKDMREELARVVCSRIWPRRWWSSNGRSFWGYLEVKKEAKVEIGLLKNVAGEVGKRNKEMAEELN